MYQCTHCGHQIPTPLGNCPNCGVLLGRVRCHVCGHVGTQEEYRRNHNRCPECKTQVNDISLGHRTPSKDSCPNCGADFNGKLGCGECEYLHWKGLLPMLAIGEVLFSAFWWQLPWWDLTLLIGLPGAFLLLLAVINIGRAVFHKRRRR